jgi:hypothetical protein
MIQSQGKNEILPEDSLLRKVLMLLNSSISMILFYTEGLKHMALIFLSISILLSLFTFSTCFDSPQSAEDE